MPASLPHSLSAPTSDPAAETAQRDRELRRVAKQGLILLAVLLLAGICVGGLRFLRYQRDAALLDAVEADDTAKAEDLLRHGANIETRVPPYSDSIFSAGFTPLAGAISRGNKPMANLLLAHGANIHATQPTEYAISSEADIIMSTAVESGRTDMIDVLLDHGADIEAKSNGTYTPLMLAVVEHRLAVARHLIERGASLNARDRGNHSVLQVAQRASEDAQGSAASLEMLKLVKDSTARSISWRR